MLSLLFVLLLAQSKIQHSKGPFGTLPDGHTYVTQNENDQEYPSGDKDFNNFLILKNVQSPRLWPKKNKERLTSKKKT